MGIPLSVLLPWFLSCGVIFFSFQNIFYCLHFVFSGFFVRFALCFCPRILFRKAEQIPFKHTRLPLGSFEILTTQNERFRFMSPFPAKPKKGWDGSSGKYRRTRKPGASRTGATLEPGKEPFAGHLNVPDWSSLEVNVSVDVLQQFAVLQFPTFFFSRRTLWTAEKTFSCYLTSGLFGSASRATICTNELSGNLLQQTSGVQREDRHARQNPCDWHLLLCHTAASPGTQLVQPHLPTLLSSSAVAADVAEQ